MELMEVKKHLKNFTEGGEEKPALEVKTMIKDETWETVTMQHNLLFAIEGNMHLTVGYQKEKELKKGFFLFVPASEPVYMNAKTNLVFIIVRTSNLDGLCDAIRMEQLYRSQKDEDMELDARELYISLIQSPVWHYLNGVYTALSDGIKFQSYFEAKVKELYMLLWAYYSKKELYQIFSRALTDDIAFSDAVKNSWQKYKTIDDLAEAMRLTPSSFYRHFLKTFGCTARHWITEQKKQLIYKDLIQNKINFKELADKYWFSSVSSFNNWCVKVYGHSPGDMRKKNHDYWI
jgi:AraC-like DNA-binding protein/mannose-6-phosphate isomerase-like protein (cupin superfamily)